MARRKVKYSPEVLEQFIQPEDLAEATPPHLHPKNAYISHERPTLYPSQERTHFVRTVAQDLSL